jgi:hypothetical protein
MQFSLVSAQRKTRAVHAPRSFVENDLALTFSVTVG